MAGKGKMHDQSKPSGVKKGSAPFARSWSNSRPMGSHGGTHPSPGGTMGSMGKGGSVSGSKRKC